ncbi:hypothetical protein KEM55_002901 [Ascosphaera atra]|nr:hypothetical protein KEM55_002901 [Ascosphaera atra]
MSDRKYGNLNILKGHMIRDHSEHKPANKGKGRGGGRYTYKGISTAIKFYRNLFPPPPSTASSLTPIPSEDEEPQTAEHFLQDFTQNVPQKYKLSHIKKDELLPQPKEVAASQAAE